MTRQKSKTTDRQTLGIQENKIRRCKRVEAEILGIVTMQLKHSRRKMLSTGYSGGKIAQYLILICLSIILIREVVAELVNSQILQLCFKKDFKTDKSQTPVVRYKKQVTEI